MTIPLFKEIDAEKVQQALTPYLAALPKQYLTFAEALKQVPDLFKAITSLLDGAGVPMQFARSFSKAMKGESFDRDSALQATIRLRELQKNAEKYVAEGDSLRSFIRGMLDVFESRD